MRCLFQIDFLEYWQVQPNARIFRWSLLLIVYLAATMGSSASGQESSNESSKESAGAIAELDEGAESKDLLKAIQSLDETLSQPKRLHEQKQKRNRLVGFGLIVGAFLALLSVLFAYLRLQHATRGFHAGRLQLLAGIISILILATCYYLWMHVLF